MNWPETGQPFKFPRLQEVFRIKKEHPDDDSEMALNVVPAVVLVRCCSFFYFLAGRIALFC
ncbi:hypothetical protein Patl1_26786 [Pistacia atlantica]|uniref:Uncharacterized protein n=1 Tax=Pistacia atlantica TaxID=434234 RepID=A0ACC1B1P4_9ROSI|nr:hypothetical protein Patl1_26786 [Pistacia atlantica]